MAWVSPRKKSDWPGWEEATKTAEGEWRLELEGEAEVPEIIIVSDAVEGRRQMAAAAGKKSTSSLSLFMAATGFEVEEEITTMATQHWEEGVWTGRWSCEQNEAWMMQIREVRTWKQVRGPGGAVMCETLDLGIKWPQWHTLMFSLEIKIDMRFVCPKDV